VLNDCANWRALRRIQNNALPFLGDLPQENGFLDATSAIRQAKLDI
jgi:hypothetical protein